MMIRTNRPAIAGTKYKSAADSEAIVDAAALKFNPKPKLLF
jgi:hypothetical protein